MMIIRNMNKETNIELPFYILDKYEFKTDTLYYNRIIEIITENKKCLISSHLFQNTKSNTNKKLKKKL